MVQIVEPVRRKWTEGLLEAVGPDHQNVVHCLAGSQPEVDTGIVGGAVAVSGLGCPPLHSVTACDPQTGAESAAVLGAGLAALGLGGGLIAVARRRSA